MDDGDEEDQESVAPSDPRGRGYKKSEGFSIMPDADYLPTPAPASGKKKKKKSRGSSSALPALAISPFSPEGDFKPSPRKNSSAAELSTGDEAETATHSRATTGSSGTSKRFSHNRQASLGRPPDMSLEELLDHREKTIDNLRAEIGIAKAEEGKAREEALQMKKGQDQMQEQLRRLRKSPGRETEALAQRRESEVSDVFHISTCRPLRHDTISRLCCAELRKVIAVLDADIIALGPTASRHDTV